MTNIEIAKETLLNPTELNEGQLETVLGHALGPAVDSADIYLQSIKEESWYLEDGIVKEANFSIDRGFGLRVISGEKTGFAYADQIDFKALQNAAKAARSISSKSGQQNIQSLRNRVTKSLYPDLDPLCSLTEAEKVGFLKKIDETARKKDPRVEQVMVRLAGSYEVILLMNSEGQLAADIRPQVTFTVRVIVMQNGRREVGYSGGGARSDYQFFLRNNAADKYVEEAVRQALLNLEAADAPAGMMPVVLGPGWPAVLLHEAVGHGLEGDFNRKGSSAFSGRRNQQVASSLCTIVDDGTIPGRPGSLTVDDEGTPTQHTVLIENGILKNYLQDRLNARLMKMQPTGNGRRENYANLPLPRMTNTYLLPGKSDPQEIIGSVKRGIYAVDFSGGQVDITSGKFVFTTSEAYLIENGKITIPVKGATLVGDGPTILTHVSMVGNDLQLDKGLGICGKQGQTVPVGVGQPTIKVEGMTVGGVSDGSS